MKKIDYESLKSAIYINGIREYHNKLPEKRKKVVFQFLNGNSYKEIAYNLNLSYNTVKHLILLFENGLKKHNTSSYRIYKALKTPTEIKICKKCAKIIQSNNKKFCNKTCANTFNRNIIVYNKEKKKCTTSKKPKSLVGDYMHYTT